jgi:hypothetical protein
MCVELASALELVTDTHVSAKQSPSGFSCQPVTPAKSFSDIANSPKFTTTSTLVVTPPELITFPNTTKIP